MSTYSYSFGSHSFYLNGRSEMLNVIPKVTEPGGTRLSASLTGFAMDSVHALKLQLNLNDPANPSLEITQVTNPDLTGFNTEFMALTYTTEVDPNGLYGATSLGISYLTSQDSPPSIQRLVLGGLGVTYIEATDPTFMKVFQFGINSTVYLVISQDTPNSMKYLQISWD